MSSKPVIQKANTQEVVLAGHFSFIFKKISSHFHKLFFSSKKSIIHKTFNSAFFFLFFQKMEVCKFQALLNDIERALFDMYTEGMADLNEMILVLPLCPPDQKEAKIAQIKEKVTDRYLPVFEKVMLKSHGQDYIVGNRLSGLTFTWLNFCTMWKSLTPALWPNFPLLKALKTRISNLPPVKKFLQPGSQRKPPISEEDLEKARKIFRIK
uniref:glutathione transferase n=1 Tax=Lynx canadensis TaxID=61383 RepID=A0A667G4C3_LYNCA